MPTPVGIHGGTKSPNIKIYVMEMINNYFYLSVEIVYYVPRPGNRILHSRVDGKHANMISYFPAEVRILFFFIPRLEGSPKHARFAAGKLQVLVTSYTENM